jgi:hypothetical protein
MPADPFPSPSRDPDPLVIARRMPRKSYGSCSWLTDALITLYDRGLITLRGGFGTDNPSPWDNTTSSP